jgi:hypothetical protein
MKALRDVLVLFLFYVVSAIALTAVFLAIYLLAAGIGNLLEWAL